MIIHIAAIAENNAIGKDNQVPWDLPKDMEHFKQETKGNTVVMGRKTFESIGKPLPGRDNIIITSRERETDATVCNSIDDALDEAAQCRGDTYIIGGESIYEQTMDRADKLLITHVKRHVDGDTFYPGISPMEWQGETVEETDEFTIREYTRC